MQLLSKFRIVELIGISIMVSLGLQGCFITGPPKVTWGNDQQLEAGIWTVDGVALDDTQRQVADLLGTPSTTYDNVKVFDVHGTKVTFDGSGRVMRVSGRTLMQNGRVLVESQDLEWQIFDQLGNGYQIESFAPKGGGIISTGSVFNGARHFFDSDKTRFRLYVNQQRTLINIEARRLSDDPKYWH